MEYMIGIDFYRLVKYGAIVRQVWRRLFGATVDVSVRWVSRLLSDVNKEQRGKLFSEYTTYVACLHSLP